MTHMIDKIKKAIAAIKGDKLYSTDEINEMGVIVNTKLEPSSFTLYRLIKNGKLPAVDIGTGSSARHFVKGSDLKKYLQETYKL